ncbi:hypothetical protein [Conexibacter sp. SYSU D00693]|uniref:hypothetical protein n=1 Tax=Conexibacter sp. SYSU D00693 TaxID=2812560 RepID=UPI00196B3BD6|nr:hypothetical protein [Conexibacter sp. SYSU D00693]
MGWRSIAFFRISERHQAERAAQRAREASEDTLARVERCRGRGGLVVRVGGPDERRVERPVERDRRAKAPAERS